MSHLLRAITVTLVLASVVSAREWSDSTGKFKIEAEFVSLEDGHVHLKKVDGSTIDVPLERLSDLDRGYVNALVSAKMPASSAPAARKPLATPPLVEISAPSGVTEGVVRRFTDLNWGVRSLAYSPSGKFIAAGKQDKGLLLFDVEKGVLVTKIEDDLEGLGNVGCCAFSRDGKRLLTSTYRGPIVVWEVDAAGRMRKLRRFNGHLKEAQCIALSRDGTRVLSGDSEKKLIYWELETGRILHEFTDSKRKIEDCYFTPNGKQALATDGNMVRLYDLVDPKFLQAMEVKYGTEGVAISPDGRHHVACFGYDVRIFNTITGEAKSVNAGEPLWSVAFSPDSKQVFTGGRAKVFRWDVESAEHLGTLEIPKALYIKLVDCSPDGKHIAASSASAQQDIVVVRLPEP